MPMNADHADPKCATAAATSAEPIAGADPDSQHARRTGAWGLPPWSKHWGRQFARRLQDNARWMKSFLHGRK